MIVHMTVSLMKMSNPLSVKATSETRAALFTLTANQGISIYFPNKRGMYPPEKDKVGTVA